MNRCVAYLVNENPLYLKMCLNSLGMLRDHNRKIIVRVILIRDHTNETYVETFVNQCLKLGVEVMERIPLAIVGEENFFHVNRKYLSEIPENDILYTDSDTFIFGDIETIFENHKEVDFAACEAQWSFQKGYRRDFVDKNIGPFSSGLMLWNHGTVRDWCDMIPRYFAEFRRNESPLANWLHELHPDCLLREEFSVTQHVSRSDLTHSFISAKECHLIQSLGCIDQIGESLIFHSYTPHWRRAYQKIHSSRPKKISFGKIKTRIDSSAPRVFP
jgi:hypothetical protein